MGCFPGGLDSSILAAVAAQGLREKGNPDTFSVTYRDNDRYFRATFQPNSDDEYIGIMTQLGSRHHRIQLDTQGWPTGVRRGGRQGPARHGGRGQLFAAVLQKVRQDITVALGECADEIFGGYPWYRDPEILAQQGFPWAQSTAFRATLLQRDALGGLDPAQFVEERYRAAVLEAHVLPETGEGERRMREMTGLNFGWFMQTLLDRKDRMGMYCGLEVRVPFCDHRIAEYLYAAPWPMKELGGYEKGLLRQAMAGILPEKVRLRKKSPIQTTTRLCGAGEGPARSAGHPGSPLWTMLIRRGRHSGPGAPAKLVRAAHGRAPDHRVFVQVEYWLRKYRVRIAGTALDDDSLLAV